VTATAVSAQLELHATPVPVSRADPAHLQGRSGIGLRAQHHAEIIARLPPIGWFEAHSENYFASGGSHRKQLLQIRQHYDISVHGVGLSLGSTDPMNRDHLRALCRLVNAVEPVFVSEHLSWGSVDGTYLNDLLPLPYTDEALRHLVTRVCQVQEALGREILIENISSYLRYRCNEVPEWEFLSALAHESGCGLLLDVNNVYVNAMNHGFDPHSFLHGVPPAAVREIHLAGHTVMYVEGREVRIDTHSTHVADEVWRLYGAALNRFGPVPTLIEWDADIPDLVVLEAEATRASLMLEAIRAVAA
jgi:uncharacterized protein (UPF0276 family)